MRLRLPRLGRAAWVVLALLVALNLGMELVLTGADYGWWGQSWWRFAAFDLGGFRRTLLLGEPPLYPGQTVVVFLSHAFLHAGAFHVLGNMAALLALGPSVLRRTTLPGFALIYLGSAAGGALAFLALSQTSYPMVGASGAIFGLAGAEALPRRPDGGRRLAVVLVELVVLNLVLWLATGGLVAWQAHLGGFATGLALSLIAPRPRAATKRFAQRPE